MMEGNPESPGSESFGRVRSQPQAGANDIRAVPVDVVDSSLRFQAAGVNPKKHQRAPLLIVDNLEGQSAQVVLVPTPGQSSKKQNVFNLFMCSAV